MPFSMRKGDGGCLVGGGREEGGRGKGVKLHKVRSIGKIWWSSLMACVKMNITIGVPFSIILLFNNPRLLVILRPEY